MKRWAVLGLAAAARSYSRVGEMVAFVEPLLQKRRYYSFPFVFSGSLRTFREDMWDFPETGSRGLARFLPLKKGSSEKIVGGFGLWELAK
jgi:hypothetical protein